MLNLEIYVRVLLVMNGSGPTFAIGLVDEVVRAHVKNIRKERRFRQIG